jgi:hypothetical protein
VTSSRSPDHNTRRIPVGESELKSKAAAYFGGEMSPGETAIFEAELVAHPELAHAVYDEMGMGPVFHEALQALRIRHLESHARLPDSSVTRRVPWWGRTRSRFALTAAVAAVVLVIVTVSNIGETPPVKPPSGNTDTEGFRGLSPAGLVEALPAQFSWTAHPTAAQYRVEIYDDSSVRFFETITTHTTLIVAIDELSERGLRAGYWRVVPLDQYGSEFAATADVPFTVKTR